MQSAAAPKRPLGTGADVFEQALAQGFGDVHFKVDSTTGLAAIIAIHNTQLGPALGGCRCIPYRSAEAALFDAMRLARGMTYKAAISGLASGGGKAVLIRPPEINDREAYFESFGRFVDQLGGRYITAVDSGTSVSDMDIIARCTKHVACTSESRAGTGDPSPHTAVGVRRGIEAAVKFRLNKDDLDGVHVAIQGVGHVGYSLARDLAGRGAKLTVSDMNQRATQRCADEFGAVVAAPERIYDIPSDVFAPCALGAIINDDTLPRLNTRIVAGAANNQLAEVRHGDELHKRGIVYAPDYLVNAGGIIQIIIEDESEINEKILNIYNTLASILERSAATNTAPHRVADIMVDAMLSGQRSS
ncbi:MAG: Glu/Leu/Phe/Val dehydrogenase dimerization domain-containing protein [Acidiferrobacterales bacterium]